MIALLAGVGYGAISARAQNAMWLANPGTNDFNTAANWAPATVPTGSAVFGASTRTLVTFSANTVVGDLTFNAGAPFYSFRINPTLTVSLNGRGVVNNSSSPSTSFDVVGTLQFRNAATAADAGISLDGGTVTFLNTSSAASAGIGSLGGGTANFRDSSTAANATLGGGNNFNFFDNATAATAKIGGFFQRITFNDNSTAGNATFDLVRSNLAFNGASSAGNAVIFSTSPFNTILFADTSTAANANIDNQVGFVRFINASTAANATISNRFTLSFGETASAGNAAILNSNTLNFLGSSTAANATITMTNGGALFFQNSTGGQARFILNNGGIDIAGLASTGTTVGSIEGTGIVRLGSKALTIGTNNLSTTYNGVFDDAGAGGSLIKTGTGTLTLGGASAYTGPTVVNSGTLAVNGSIASAVTVKKGAILGGTGAVGPTTINSGGTLAPGNSIGTITINGNLVFGAGSIYHVEVSPTAADRTNVSGSATLGGEARLVFSPGAYTANSYTILSAAGGRTGTFDTTTTQGLPATLSASLAYTPTDVLLVTLTSQIAPTVAMLAGATPNQKAVAGAQDRAFNGGLPAVSALYNLPLGQVPAALDQLSGEVHASTAGVLMDESLYMRSAVLGRLRQASYGGDMGAMAALRIGGPQAFADGEELGSALAYAKSPLVAKAPIRDPRPSPDTVFWAQGFGAWGRFDTDGNAARVRRDLAGFIAGVDTRVGGNGRAGIAAGYTDSRNVLDARGTAGVETGHVAAYGAWNFGALNLRGGGAVAFHSIDTDRMISFPGFFDRAIARYDGTTGQVFGELGYGFAVGHIAVEPFAGAAWVRVQADAAAERGGIAALNFVGTTFEEGYSTLGVRAATMIPVASDMILIPRAALAWQHAFNTITPTAIVAFQAAPAPFLISGVPIARDSLLAEAGFDLAVGRHATLGLSYVGQLADNVHDHAAKGKFTWKF